MTPNFPFSHGLYGTRGCSLLAFPSTFALWRRMTLWEITSYADALARERDRQLARAELREKHGRRWRSKTPRTARVLLKLGEVTPAESTQLTLDVNREETQSTTVNQSMSDQPVSTPAAEPATAEQSTPESADSAPAANPTPTTADSPPGGKKTAAKSTPRRSTGRVPKSARSPRPKRTPEQLLAEARQVTADWPDDALTGEAIRKAVRTAPPKARQLRDTLKAERTAAAENDPVAA